MTNGLKESAVALRFRWRRNEADQEADDLTNECFDKFGLDPRVDCSLKDLRLNLFVEASILQCIFTCKGGASGCWSKGRTNF